MAIRTPPTVRYLILRPCICYQYKVPPKLDEIVQLYRRVSKDSDQHFNVRLESVNDRDVHQLIRLSSSPLFLRKTIRPVKHPVFSLQQQDGQHFHRRKSVTVELRKIVSAFPCFDFHRKAMEREWRVRGGQILGRGLTAGNGLKGVKCYYCKGYVCGREY